MKPIRAMIPKNLAGAASFYRCDCGKNEFHRIGVFSMADVEMDEDGRWFLKRPTSERRRYRHYIDTKASVKYGGE